MSKEQTQATTSFIHDQSLIGEMVVNKVDHSTEFCIWDGADVRIVKNAKQHGITLIPYSPQNPLIQNNVIRFPSKAVDYESTTKLKETIEYFIKRYLEVPENIYPILVHYVLLTWVYDAFNELPYLRTIGDFGAGKTRFLSVIGALCYKPIMASGASTVAPLFHILNQIGGTLILDEADFRFSSETSDITKILNNGHAKGFPVLRCEMNKNKEFFPKTYNVFSPKIIASRHRYQDEALESRCITIDMTFRRTRDDIPMSLPSNFEGDAHSIRNQLLRWRFDHLFEQAPSIAKIKDLTPRLQQIYNPLLSLVNNDQIQIEIIKFAKDKAAQQKRDLGLQTEAELLHIIRRLKQKKQAISITELTDEFQKQYQTLYDRRITPKWIGSIVRNKLRLTTHRSNGRYVLAENQNWLLNKLYDKYDVDDPTSSTS